MPNNKDIKDGVIAYKIAGHAADLPWLCRPLDVLPQTIGLLSQSCFGHPEVCSPFMSKRRDTDEHAVSRGQNKTTDRWFDLTKLLIGFVLTGLIGTWLTEEYKDRETRAEIQRKELQDATNAFYEVIDGLSKRHYYALRSNAAVEAWNNQTDPQWRKTDGRKLIEDAFKLYDESVIEWNAHRFRTRVILAAYFGESYWIELEQKVVHELGQTKEDLDNLRDHALDDGYYDEKLHDRILDHVENGEENVLVALCERLSKSIQDRQKQQGGMLSWLTRPKKGHDPETKNPRTHEMRLSN